MSDRYVAIALKVPDNTAFTALVALQRLGVPVERVERARVVLVSGESESSIIRQVSHDESLFNPNLHRVEIRDSKAPLEGELWVRASGELRSPRLARGDNLVAWRLFGERGPVSREVLERARDALLCNPAFETAELPA
jgi:phosphoribosylformylglycinamidine (FGAM) synthase PurS component